MDDEKIDWTQYIPAGRVVELAGHWKHGWIPLDATATTSKLKKGKSGKRRKVLTVREVPTAAAGKRDKNKPNPPHFNMYGTGSHPARYAQDSRVRSGKWGAEDIIAAHTRGEMDDAQARNLGNMLMTKGDGAGADRIRNHLKAHQNAANYTKMHGSAGAQKKLDALKRKKNPTASDKAHIAALTRALR